MGNIGNLGDISFYCSTSNGKGSMLSFMDLQRNSTTEFGEHERNGEKSYLEFNKNGLEELTLTIVADARYGIKPGDVQDKLYAIKDSGEAVNFVLGGKKVGDNPYVITAINQGYSIFHSDGRPVKMTFNVTLKEYANTVAAITTIPTRSVGDASTTTAAVTTSDTYTVVSGDSLWKISSKFYGKGSQWSKIYNANKDKIKNPNLIYAGQVFTIPK